MQKIEEVESLSIVPLQLGQTTAEERIAELEE